MKASPNHRAWGKRAYKVFRRGPLSCRTPHEHVEASAAKNSPHNERARNSVLLIKLRGMLPSASAARPETLPPVRQDIVPTVGLSVAVQLTLIRTSYSSFAPTHN